MIKQIIGFIFIYFALAVPVWGQQDAHSSFWYKSPLLINPAYSKPDGRNFKLFTDMRLQWMTLDGAKMRTNNALFSARLPSRSSKGYFTFGASFTNDETGQNKITTNTIGVPINYAIFTGKSSIFSLGVTPKMISRNITSGGSWDAQWAGTYFDMGMNNQEGNLNRGSAFMLDLAGGLYFSKQPHRNKKFYIGVSVDHILTPKVQSFIYSADQIHPRIQFQAGGEFASSSNKRIIFAPRFYGSYQANHFEAVGGLEVKQILRTPSRSLIFQDGVQMKYAVFYRFMDAVILQISYLNQGFEVGFSYDTNVSPLMTRTSTVGAVQLFLSYEFGHLSRSYEFR